jgi:hypothetical protein
MPIKRDNWENGKLKRYYDGSIMVARAMRYLVLSLVLSIKATFESAECNEN